MRCCGIHLIAISQKILKIFIIEISLKFSHLKLVKFPRGQWVISMLDTTLSMTHDTLCWSVFYWLISGVIPQGVTDPHHIRHWQMIHVTLGTRLQIFTTKLIILTKFVFAFSPKHWSFNVLTLIHLPPSAAYMSQRIGWALVQIMACRQSGAKPLSEFMLTYYQLDPKEHISIKFYLKLKYFH